MPHTIKDILQNPGLAFFTLGRTGFLNWMSDELYLKIAYKIRTGKKLDLKNPTSFNEKMQWLKIHDRKPEYSDMVDKYAAKKMVSDKIGEEFVIPLIGVWDKYEDINIDALPPQFVLKCTHNSGGLLICKNKADVNWAEVERQFKRCLKSNFYWVNREWPYKNVNPKIIAEEYKEDRNSQSLKVYKIFNFNGLPFLIQTIQNDKTDFESINYYDVSWRKLDIRQNYPNSDELDEQPSNLREMLWLAEKLSAGFKFLRTDFFSVNGKTYFSEFTFYSDAGFENFYPEKWDIDLGKMIVL